MTTQVLDTNRYLEPGAYEGQIYAPKPTTLSGAVRYPCYVARGSRLKIAFDQPITRSFIEAYRLAFSGARPYLATLAYPANSDKTNARLYDQNDVVVPEANWIFIDNGTPGNPNYNQIQIDDQIFDATKTYYLDYQSTSRDIVDPLPVDDIREVVRCGDYPNQELYREGIGPGGNGYDFIINTDVQGQVSDKLKLVPWTSTSTGPSPNAHPDSEQGIQLGVTSYVSPTQFSCYILDMYANYVPSLSQPPEYWAGKTGEVIRGTGKGQVFTIDGWDSTTGELVLEVTTPLTTPVDASSIIIIYDGFLHLTTPHVGGVDINITGATVGANGASTPPGTRKIVIPSGTFVNDFYNGGWLIATVAGTTVTAIIINTIAADADEGGSHTIIVDRALGALGAAVTALRVYHGGHIEYNTASSYNHFYHRLLTAECDSVSGAAPNRTWNFTLITYPISPGNRMESPHRYLAHLKESAGTPVVDVWRMESDLGNVSLTYQSASPQGIVLDNAISVDFLWQFLDLGGVNDPTIVPSADFYAFRANDIFTTSGIGPALFELDSAFENTNQRAGFSAVSIFRQQIVGPTSGATGAAGSVTLPTTLAMPEAEMFVGRDFVVLDGPAIGTYTITNYTPATNILTVSPVLGGALGVTDTFTIDISDGSISVDSTSEYTGTSNRTYVLYVTGIGPLPLIPADPKQFDYEWYGFGGDEGVITTGSGTWIQGTSGLITLDPDVYVHVDLGTISSPKILVKGDYFVFKALAQRELYVDKDDRTYDLTVGTVVDPTPIDPPASPYQYATLPVSYTTNTQEGSFGIFTNNGTVDTEINSALRLWARNTGARIECLTTVYYCGGFNMHCVNDKHSFECLCLDTIDWSLTYEEEETIPSTNVFRDTTGSITGVPGYYYVQTTEVPISVSSILNEGGITISGAIWIVGTRIISFSTKPQYGGADSDVTVKYIHRGDEPAPGDVYYITLSYKRPSYEYNEPIFYDSVETAQQALSPAGTTNHALIMSEIAFECNAPGIYVCQVQDINDDGIYTDDDYKTAILATEKQKAITDLIVIGANNLNYVSTAKASVIRCNDPFTAKHRILWVGMPIATPIGDSLTPNTIVYMAKNTLQVYGQNPAHGCFVLAANTYETRDIKLMDGSVVEQELDGSYFAGASAAIQDSFSAPYETILRKNIPGFKFIGGADVSCRDRNFNTSERQLIGDAGCIFANDQGSGVYIFGESQTVDKYSNDTSEISATVQKQTVTRRIASDVDAAVISLVPATPADGAAVIKLTIATSILSLIEIGWISPYLDDSGNRRDMNTQTDIQAFQSSRNRTRYYYRYLYWLKYPIKTALGLYAVDTQSFDALLRG